MNKENASKLWKIIQEAGLYLGDQRYTLLHTSYADNLKLIKNKLHKDSLKISLKLVKNLVKKKINQMVHSRAFWQHLIIKKLLRFFVFYKPKRFHFN